MYYYDINEISQLISSRRISCSQVTSQLLSRIQTHDKAIGSYSYLQCDEALKQAKILDKELASGCWRGCLHGVPIAVKDIFAIEGLPFEIGMPCRRGETANITATVVKKLIASGAVILGKLHTTEGIYAEHTKPFVAPKNPWSHEAWVGVSSSGCGAATASGFAYATLGSDTGGSIRMPCAANGVTGLKPTWGKCSRYGVFALAPTLDHVGPMTRSARDAGIILDAIVGPDFNDYTSTASAACNYSKKQSKDLSGFRIGVDYEWSTTDISATVRKAFFDAIDVYTELNAEVVPINFPDTTYINSEAWFTICGVQAAEYHKSWFDENIGSYGNALKELIELGRSTRAGEYHCTLLDRLNFKGATINLFSNIDAIMTPTLPYEAPLASDMLSLSSDKIAEIHRYTVPFTMSQLPTLTMPSGFSNTELPVSIQLIGEPNAERKLLRIGSAFQSVTDHHKRHPTL